MKRLLPVCLLPLLAAALAGSAWAQTAISLSAAPANSSTFGQTVTLTAVVNLESSGSFTVTFLDGTATLGTATTNSNNTATFQISTLSAGTHSLTATTPNFNAGVFTSNTVLYTVNKAPTTTTLTVSPGTTTFGQTVTMTATVSPGVLGTSETVTFFDNGATLATVALGSSGTATFVTSTLAVGSHSITATYNGDLDYAVSTSTPKSETVNKASPTIALASSLNPSNVGQNVTFTATVTPAGPTGTVTFFDLSTPISTQPVNSSGIATFSTSSLTAGTHNINAVYNGDSNDFGSSSNTVVQVVNQSTSPTTTTLTASPNPAALGQPVTLTARVTPATATGTVTFHDGTNTIGTAPLSGGTATTTTSTLTLGSHTLTATYGGDSANGSSTSAPFTEVIGKTATTTSLTASPNPATPGQAVTITATVSPSGATGTVAFTDGATSLGTATLSGNGTASITTSSLAAGSHSLSGTYSGDGNFTGSTGTFTEVIGKASTTTSLTASPNPATPGQAVTITATVSPAGATGTVAFTDGANPLGTATLSGNGTASITTSSLAAGSHPLSATYSGDGNFTGSTGSFTLVVGKTPTTTNLTASPVSATVGQAVTLTATVSPSGPTGSVTFVDVTTSATLGTAPLNGGAASITVSTLAAGSHTLAATYSGDTNFNSSTSGPVGVAIGQGTSAITLSAAPNPQSSGLPVTLSAVVTPTSATGTVTFKDNGAMLGTVTLANGVASITTSALTVGNHSLTATYSGDNTFSPSTSNTVTEAINQATGTTTTILTVSPNPGTVGQPVTLTATVTPATATGTVTFLDGGNTLGTGTVVNGSASFSTTTLTAGSHSLTAAYSGDSANGPSTSSAVTELINGNLTVNLAAAPNPATFGQTVTLTITVTPASSAGTVTVFDSVSAGTVGGTATLIGGAATITISTLKVGSHSLQAFYSGPGNLTGQSNFVTEVINAAPTTTALTVSSNLLTATVTPAAATGTVTFKDGSTTLGTGTLSNGTATFTATTLSTGSHTLTATYNGDGNFAPSTSNTVTVTPGLTNTTTKLTVSPASSTLGQTVTLTAAVTPSTATGTVTFLDGSTTLGTGTLSGGTATLTTAKLTSGTHTLTASYGGDSSDAPSTSSAVTATVSAGTPLQITTSSIPAGFVGVAYSQTFAASGGTGTLTWSAGPNSTPFVPGAVDGLTMSAAGVLSGTPTNTGSFPIAVRVTDSAGNSNAVVLSLTVNPASSVQITTSSIPAGFAGVAYSQTFAASGGTGTLTWSAGPNNTPFVPGAVDGLTMSAAGVLSGTPTAAGTFSIAVRVTDSAGSSNAVVLTLTVNPALPPINITVTQPTAITDQPAPTVSLSPGYPVALNGTYRLTFTSTPSLGAGYTAVQFVTGGTTTPVLAIPANSTAPVTLPAVQLGSVAGTITVQLASLTIAGTGQAVPLPTPAPSVAITVPRLAPIIVPGSVKITNVTASGFQVILDASSTPRDLASANFTFSATSGSTLNGASQTVSLTSVATPWFDPSNAAGVSNGGAFSLTFPFTFNGSISALGTVSVTLTNSVGTSAAVSGGQ